MPKFIINTEWSGYSRGTSVYLVEAENEEWAREQWYKGERIEHNVVRDDTKKEIISINQQP